jgi:hypothetical protein
LSAAAAAAAAADIQEKRVVKYYDVFMSWSASFSGRKNKRSATGSINSLFL